MAVTPQTNTTLEELAARMAHADNFVICGHQSPDGDCLGATLALVCGLRSLGKHATGLVVDTPPENLLFLPGADELVSPAEFSGVCDCFIAVDVPDIKRMKDAGPLHEAAPLTLRIDHHANPERVSDYSYTDSSAVSASSLVWEVCGYLGVQTRDVATCCYAGMVTDSGRFAFQNTDERTFRLAAQMIATGVDVAWVTNNIYESDRVQSLQLEARALEHLTYVPEGHFGITTLSQEDFAEFDAVPADAENVVNSLRRIKDLQVICYLREQDGSVRASFRAKNDVDVSAIARKFGGGGHVPAAGATLSCSLPEAVEQVYAALYEACVPAHVDEGEC